MFDSGNERKPTGAAQVRRAVVALACFLLGLALGAYWYHRATNPIVTSVSEPGSSLTASTRAILKQLNSVIEIRFYSLLEPATISDALRAFSVRVDQLLSEYEREAGGKIKVTRQMTRSDSAAQAASADGVRGFNLDKGDACFLGVAVACGGQKETLGQLSPEWEAALESDLSRAIARAAAAKPAVRSAIAIATKVDASVIEEVKRAIPNLDSVSLTAATQTLRVAALKEFVAATEEMERAVKEAEQRVQQAQNRGSEADRQSAVKHLQQVQAEHTEKLKQITAALQSRIAALSQLKGQ